VLLPSRITPFRPGNIIVPANPKTGFNGRATSQYNVLVLSHATAVCNIIIIYPIRGCRRRCSGVVDGRSIFSSPPTPAILFSRVSCIIICHINTQSCAQYFYREDADDDVCHIFFVGRIPRTARTYLVRTYYKHFFHSGVCVHGILRNNVVPLQACMCVYAHDNIHHTRVTHSTYIYIYIYISYEHIIIIYTANDGLQRG